MGLKVPGYAEKRAVQAGLPPASSFLKELLALWLERRGDRLMPARADFDAAELMRFAGRIALIDVEYDPKRYRFRLIGSRITEILGRDSTGRYIDDLYEPAFYPTAIGSYEVIQRDRAPVTALGDMKRIGKEHIRFESLDLPLSSDGTVIDMIMKGTFFSDFERE